MSLDWEIRFCCGRQLDYTTEHDCPDCGLLPAYYFCEECGETYNKDGQILSDKDYESEDGHVRDGHVRISFISKQTSWDIFENVVEKTLGITGQEFVANWRAGIYKDDYERYIHLWMLKPGDIEDGQAQETA